MKLQLTAVLCMLLALCVPATARTVSAVMPERPEAAQSAPRLDAADIDDWLDGFMGHAMPAGDIAGAVVVVVKDGKLLTQRGYGFADVEARRAVRPEATLFRVGSISKLFTWTAVMQLVEERKIDLDADINRYLDFRIPPRGGKPVTMRQLMTHTAGFDERLKGLFTAKRENLVPLDIYIKSWTPKRVYDAGAVPAYSNYGAALAGYIVQRVSGKSYDEYVEQKIFDPLGMTRSSLRQPLPARFTKDMATPYLRASGGPRAYELMSAGPAGSLSATGADIARFMIAHLQNGQYGSRRILAEGTARQMHAEQKKIVPSLNAMALGFYREDRNGRPIIGHAGATEGFYSDLHLLTDDNVGIFISMNSAGKDGAAGKLLRSMLIAFVDRYFPVSAAPLPTTRTAKSHAKIIEGYYWPSRRMDTSFFAIGKLANQSQVVALPDGRISVSTLKNAAGDVKTWREIAPYLWEDETATARLSAVVRNGQVAYFGHDGAAPVNVMQRVPFWAEARWNMLLLNVSVGILVITILMKPVMALMRRFAFAPALAPSPRVRSHWPVYGSAIIVLLALGACMFALSQLAGGVTTFDDRVDVPVRLAQMIAVLGLLSAPIATWNVVAVWRSAPVRWLQRIWSVLFLLPAWTLVWFVSTTSLLARSTEF